MKKALAPCTREHLGQLRQQLDHECVSLIGTLMIAQEPHEHSRDTYLELRHRIDIVRDVLERIDDMLAIQQCLEDPTVTSIIMSRLYRLLEDKNGHVKKRKSR